MAHSTNLRKCLTLPFHSEKWGDKLSDSFGDSYFRDNGSKVLGIAHLDTVLWNYNPMQRGQTVWAPQLDDRLGAWVLLDLLPSLGVKVDVLLTDKEEQCQSTAQSFDPPREYNWIFQFDRAGSDVVMYQYERNAYRDILSGYNLPVHYGSYSDICELEHLGVAGFNFGTGYTRQHTYRCRADLRKTRKTVNKFCRFYKDYVDVHLHHEYTPYSRYDRYPYDRDPYSDYLPEDKGRLSTPAEWSIARGFTSSYITPEESTWPPWSDENLRQRAAWKEHDHIMEVSKEFGYDNVDEFINDGGLVYC